MTRHAFCRPMRLTHVYPPMTAKERIGFAIMMAVCALIGAMLAVGSL